MPETSAVFERITTWLDGLRKAVVSLAITIAAGVLVVVVIREVYREGIAIDPVIIQVASADDAPKPELAAQQIAKNIDLSGRASASGASSMSIRLPAPSTCRSRARPSRSAPAFARSPSCSASAAPRSA
jgi:hypothetical protein